MSKVIEQMLEDDRAITQSMIDDGLATRHMVIGDEFTMEDRENFYEQMGQAERAKAAVFARQDIGIALRMIVRQSEQIAQIKALVCLIVGILFYIAYRVS